MVEIKTIKIQEHNFIGIQILLPHNPLFLITSTHCILAGEEFDIDYFDRYRPNTCIFLVEDGCDFEHLLTGRITSISNGAAMFDICEGMKGQDALVMCDAIYE